MEVLLSAQVSGFSGNGRVEQLELQSGKTVACDTVLVGIGVRPATDWLAGSGLAADAGVHWEAAAREGAAAARGTLGLATGPQPPASFWSDQYGLQIPHLGGDAAPGDPNLLLEAARACPAGAIILRDAGTGEQVFP